MGARDRPPWFLALDQGGHSTRAVVFDATGALIEQTRTEVTTAHPHPGWVEQDAEALHASVTEVLAQLVRALGRDIGNIVGAGLATQRSNVVCWDRATAAALTPALSWQDRRAERWLDGFAAHADAVRARTGLPLSPHYGASKLRWCLDHSDAVARARAGKRLACGPLASYLLAALLPGHPCLIDPANAARTLLWNLDSRDWDPFLLDLFGIPRELLPACVPTRYNFGDLSLGGHVVPLRILTGDQAAALYGIAPPDPAEVCVNLGTGAFLQRPVAARPAATDGLLCSLVYSDDHTQAYVIEGTVNGAGTALDWARDELGLAAIERKLAGWLDREGEIPLFLNGVAGLGSPWWVGHFPSRFIGQGPPWAQAVAVAESILFLLVENLARMQAVQDGIEAVRVSGGLSAFDGLCQRLADLSRLPVLRSRQREATARGLACLLARELDIAWADEKPERFVPAARPELEARYREWRTMMARAVADAGGKR